MAPASQSENAVANPDAGPPDASPARSVSCEERRDCRQGERHPTQERATPERARERLGLIRDPHVEDQNDGEEGRVPPTIVPIRRPGYLGADLSPILPGLRTGLRTATTTIATKIA
jgi:hypothetical protein